MMGNDADARLFDLHGRVAIVTGSSRGIGRAIAEGFARSGARVVITSRGIGAAQQVAAHIERAGGEALAQRLEAGDLAQIDTLVGNTIERFGRLDILVNNAAILRPHDIAKLTEDEFDELYRVNVKSAVFLAKRALPHLDAGGNGVVINLTAVGAHAPMAGIGAYCSTKAAMINWTRVMAREWGARGIRVNALTPGPVATEMILPRDPAKRAAFVRAMSGQTLLGRVAQPSEMVGPALFLASDASAFMTGQVLVVDGGMLA
jgi:NAD(P)-dependent dehydrogenase (short-subunit alcohol dehydrogenase family)